MTSGAGTNHDRAKDIRDSLLHTVLIFEGKDRYLVRTDHYDSVITSALDAAEKRGLERAAEIAGPCHPRWGALIAEKIRAEAAKVESKERGK